MYQETISLLISVNVDAGADNHELDKLTRQLRDELAELDMVSVELKLDGEFPEGAKGCSVTAGTILVKIAEAGGITALVDLLGSWLSRDRRRTLKLQLGENKLEVSGISKEEQENLVKWFQVQSGLRLKP